MRKALIVNGDTPRISTLIAESFYPVHTDIMERRHTHYWLKGGRGSAKSSFVSVEIVFGIMARPDGNALVLRKVRDTLKDSVFGQLCWAVSLLGADDLWTMKMSVPEITYNPTGQKIMFRGADNPKKLKSLKSAKGGFRYVWYEEADEFSGMEEIDNINQTALRNNSCTAFYTFNPPKSAGTWVNQALGIPRADRFVHHSDYRSVPPLWLGNSFIAEAEYLKTANAERYRHEYLGEVTGSGAEVFKNITLREISDTEISGYAKINRGVDWGYGSDPFVYLAAGTDKKRTVAVFHEFYKKGAKFDLIAEEIKKENKHGAFLIADSSEPRSNDELRSRGIHVRAAKKRPNSIEHGIKWLQDLNEIVIDPIRCPNTAKEFTGYELAPDGNGGFRAGFPDKNNHTIDALRYALEDAIGKKSVKIFDRSRLGI